MILPVLFGVFEGIVIMSFLLFVISISFPCWPFYAKAITAWLVLVPIVVVLNYLSSLSQIFK